MRGENTSYLTLKAKLHIGTFSVSNLLFRFVLKMSVTYNIADRIQDGAAIPHYVAQCTIQTFDVITFRALLWLKLFLRDLFMKLVTKILNRAGQKYKMRLSVFPDFRTCYIYKVTDIRF